MKICFAQPAAKKQGQACSSQSLAKVVKLTAVTATVPTFPGTTDHLEMLSELTPVLTSSPFPLQGFDHTMCL